MSILSIIVPLVIAGLILWALTQFPLDPTIMRIIRVVVIVIAVIWVLQALGWLGGGRGVRLGGDGRLGYSAVPGRLAERSALSLGSKYNSRISTAGNWACSFSGSVRATTATSVYSPA
jgi:hypothetical protein